MGGVDLLAIIFNAVAIGVAAVGIGLILAQPSDGSRRHKRALVALLAILAVDFASSIFDLSPAARAAPRFDGASYVLWPWIPLCLWAYVDGLTRIETSARLGWHSAVAIFGSLCLIPFLLLPDADKLLLTSDAPEANPRTLLALLALMLFVLAWMAHMLVVGVLIVRRLIAHRRRMRDLLSNVTKVDLRWVDALMAFLGVAIVVTILDYASMLTAQRELLDALGGSLFELVVVVGLVLFGATQGRAVPEWVEQIETAALAPMVAPAAEVDESRYARSSLSAEDIAAILERLDAAMRRGDPWRDPFLNLKGLAERVATKLYYLTQALNTGERRSFYDYVNGWRARAAAEALATSDASVLSICEDVGFNSKSTFNSVFRREIGLTPTAYRKLAVERRAN
ncbi:MAG TPA: AraC family transcriptional regulator [Sphingomonas sp.]|nr:AraC family transcriptional regulator [Sphingomonas sp.]